MILVVNTGSSSLKFKLFKKDLEVEKSVEYSIGGKIRSHNEAVNAMLSEIGRGKDEIEKVGYRIVHGGDEAIDLMPITLPVIKIIGKYAPFAPQHNLPAEKVIRSLIEKIPLSGHFAVFDTTFFKELPDVSKIYPINKAISEDLNIRRFGFHGISHEFAMEEADPKHEKKIITVHLGAGCSLAAIDSGKPIDTSMGFTPLEGVAMQNRSGDLDPGIIFYLIDQFGYKKARETIENNSGLAGLTNSSGDMLSLLSIAGEKIVPMPEDRDSDRSVGKDKNFSFEIDKTLANVTKEDADLAIDIYCYRIKKYLGAYIAALGGIDAIVFSGKIGFGSEVIRKKILKNSNFIDFETIIVKPDEELAIAKKLAREL